MADTKNDIATTKNAALPAHLQGGKKSKLGNIDQSDLIIPRVKLLQAISPEIEQFEVQAGKFWHTIAGETIDGPLKAVPIVIRKSIVLWSPRNDDRGVLARSSDGVNWDAGFENLEFNVKPKGAPKEGYTYKTMGNVKESGLADFGSSVPGDPNSPPAAALTYNMLFYFPEYPEFSPAVIINTRGSVRAAKNLISKIELRDVDHFGQQYLINITKENGDEGPYFGYSYTADGFVDEATYGITKELFERLGEADWKPNDDADEEAGSGTGGKSATAKDSGTSKF